MPASRHTYAKLTINGRYRGLFSVVEDVDRRYLSDRFGAADEGNLYKAGCGTLGCATLERRVGPDGDDSGRQYRVDGDDPTYDLHGKSRHLRRPRRADPRHRRHRLCPAATPASPPTPTAPGWRRCSTPAPFCAGPG